MTDTDQLAEAIEEVFPNRGRRIAALIRSGVLAPYLADVPAEALGLVPNEATTHVRPKDSETGDWLYRQRLYRRRSPEDSP